jgi:hypothetical protein
MVKVRRVGINNAEDEEENLEKKSKVEVENEY